MNNASLLSPEKSFSVDLSEYTDNNPEFEKELTTLLIGNIKELRNSAQFSLRINDHSLFKKAVHKVSVTFDMLNDQELNAEIRNINKLFESGQQKMLARAISKLDKSCLQTITFLENRLRGGLIS